MDLIEQGNAFFLAEPSNFANAAKCWLTAAQGNAADRRALFEGVKATARGGAGRPGHLLDLFHWSWLTPHVVEATKSFAHVASKDGKAREAMEHMLAQVETASVDAALAGHLRATFSTLVGEPYRDQVTLVTALFMNEFGEAKVLAERMQNSYPRLLIGHCVSFICAFEIGGGTHPQGQTMRELNNRIFWAQGLVSTVQRFTANFHVFAQGAISLALYRQVWIRFLNCYAALSSNAFVAPPAYARVAATRGGDPRCLGGLLWPELVALPYPKPWWEHSQDMARVYTQVLNPAQPDAAPAP